MAENTGGAGGFAEGMLRGYTSGADHVWIMDDDCYPQPDALASSGAGIRRGGVRAGRDVPFACSVVEFTDGEHLRDEQSGPHLGLGATSGARVSSNVMVTACSFVSVLIPRWAIAQYGLPYREYFIWFDDREYTLRLTRVCPGVQVMDSVVVHDMGDNRGVNFAMVDAKSAVEVRVRRAQRGVVPASPSRSAVLPRVRRATVRESASWTGAAWPSERDCCASGSPESGSTRASSTRQ